MNSSLPHCSLVARPVPQSGTNGWEEGNGMVLVPSSPSLTHPRNITLSQEGLRDFMFPEQFGLQLQKKKPIGFLCFFFPLFSSPTPVGVCICQNATNCLDEICTGETNFLVPKRHPSHDVPGWQLPRNRQTQSLFEATFSRASVKSNF